MDLSTRLEMNDGRRIPVLGLGVFRTAAGKQARAAVAEALAVGYRHVDTARIYGNEADVGRAVREGGVAREDVFVTTKLWNDDQGYASALRACRASLERLGLAYVDLYLIHWPVARRRLDSWRALVELQQRGLCRSIGVSNFTIFHLEELLGASPVVPAVNQVEMSPFLAQRELRAFCAQHGILVEAYSPLTQGLRLGDRRLRAIATRHGKSPAQVLIRWCLEEGVVVLPKSARPERVRENAAVFDFALTAEDRAVLDAMDENLHTSWDPSHQR